MDGSLDGRIYGSRMMTVAKQDQWKGKNKTDSKEWKEHHLMFFKQA